MESKCKRIVIQLLFLMTAAVPALAQTTVSGTVSDEEGPIVGANVIIKGSETGTVTDANGQFSLEVPQLPVTLTASFAGSETDVLVTEDKTTGLLITLTTSVQLGEVLVTGPRYGKSDFGSAPVTVEVLTLAEIRNSPAEDAYTSLTYEKGVQMTSSSFNFPAINTRGFATIANVRFVQLVDWMDVAAPLLNFPTGNIVGVSDLDLEMMELVPGASSALYGPNAFNGILIMTSKSPFDYEGLSAQVKLGMTTSDAQDNELFPTYTFTGRYAKAVSDKFAFKVNFSYMQAEDWYGNDYTTDRVNPESTVDMTSYPNFDGLNLYGDEIDIPTGVPSIGVIHRTGFREGDILDNRDAETIKADAALHYRFNDVTELSYMIRYGGGSSVYQGSQKYALRNFTQLFNKLELKGENYFVRGYITATDAGDSYNIGALGTIANEYVSPTENQWAPEYVLAMQGYIPGVPAGSHEAARTFADRNRPQPGTPAFNQLMETVRNNYFQRQPPGAKFIDASRLYHGEFQYRFDDHIEFMELMVGANFRQYSLFSDGTIFNEDPEGDGTFERINIDEYGGYVQASKTWTQDDRDMFILTGSLRYDKNENFDGQTTPRISAVYSPSKNHFLRASYQTGFRNPDTQAQFIFFDVGTNILLGSTEANAARYGVHNGGGWTLPSYQAYLASGGMLDGDTGDPIGGDPDLLVTADIPYVKPEQLSAYEIGYKYTGREFFIDLNYYYTSYENFIGGYDIISKEPTDQRGTQLDAGTRFSPYVNSPATVNSSGIGVGITYQLPIRGYQLSANYNYATFSEDTSQDPNFRANFNTPENKFNLGLTYSEFSKPVSFNVAFRYQDAFLWESDFGVGMVESFGVLDAQVSYKLNNLQSVVKLGGNNLFSGDYRTNFGGPFVGQIYYVSLTFDPSLFRR